MASSKTKLLYSKKAIDRAGETLVENPTDEEALKILNYWRGLHEKPLSICNEALFFCEEALKNFQLSTFQFVYGSARLKRAASIIQKLNRIPSMKLSRMQDIAGARIVLDANCTNWTSKTLEEIKNIGPLILKKTSDYISKPKESGYRALHFVFEFADYSELQIYQGVSIELQVRTKRQHLWAMAVETVEMLYGESLKSSQGNKDWLDFFKLASAAISHEEKAPVMSNYACISAAEIKNELYKVGTNQSFFTKLNAIKEAYVKYSPADYGYWLLDLDIKGQRSEIHGFKAEQLDTAQKMYSVLEQTPECRRGETNVVLVSTKNFEELKEAYPSYFLDVREFTDMIMQISTSTC
ncbi:MAG: RelA/SpoT domain-containing protein [Thermoguttaceae bacterium]